MTIGDTNIHNQINVSEYINKQNFICVFWIKSCSEIKWRQNYHLSTIIISNSQIETQVSYSNSNNVNVNMYFPNSILKETLVLLCLESHFDIIESWILIVDIATYIRRKNIKFYRTCGALNSCRKVKCIWRSHFPEAITTHMQNGNDFLVFK